MEPMTEYNRLPEWYFQFENHIENMSLSLNEMLCDSARTYADTLFAHDEGSITGTMPETTVQEATALMHKSAVEYNKKKSEAYEEAILEYSKWIKESHPVWMDNWELGLISHSELVNNILKLMDQVLSDCA